jgi:hypothetical protein
MARQSGKLSGDEWKELGERKNWKVGLASAARSTARSTATLAYSFANQG